MHSWSVISGSETTFYVKLSLFFWAKRWIFWAFSVLWDFLAFPSFRLETVFSERDSFQPIKWMAGIQKCRKVSHDRKCSKFSSLYSEKEAQFDVKSSLRTINKRLGIHLKDLKNSIKLKGTLFSIQRNSFERNRAKIFNASCFGGHLNHAWIWNQKLSSIYLYSTKSSPLPLGELKEASSIAVLIHTGTAKCSVRAKIVDYHKRQSAALLREPEGL